MTYLTDVRKLPKADTEKILDFCGCRILQLKFVCDDLADGEIDTDGLFSYLCTSSSLTNPGLHCTNQGGQLGALRGTEHVHRWGLCHEDCEIHS
jgi:hypothetical protein